MEKSYLKNVLFLTKNVQKKQKTNVKGEKLENALLKDVVVILGLIVQINGLKIFVTAIIKNFVQIKNKMCMEGFTIKLCTKTLH